MNLKPWMQAGWAAGIAAGLWMPAAQADAEGGQRLGQFDPVVVTASRLPSPLSQVGSSVTVITAEDLEAHGVQNVAEALNWVPGLDIAASGGPGQQISAFIRGADSGRTLLLINGLEMNDPMETARAANLAHLSADNIEKIEILRGPESAVFGSGAMGGVINIITKKGAKDWKASLDLEGGKYSTWKAVAAASGMISAWDASLGASWNYSAGFPASDAAALPAPARDSSGQGYQNWTVDAGAGGPVWPDWNARITCRGVRAYTELSDPVNWDNPDFSVRELQQSVRAESEGRLNSWWKQTFSAGFSQVDRYYRQVPLPGAPENDSDYLGRNLNLDWHNRWEVPEAGSTLAAGVNYRQEQGRIEDPLYGDFPERSAHDFGYYAEIHVQQAEFALDAAAREDVHSQFGSAFTFRLAPVYSLNQSGTSLKAAWGTGFNAPSLYQLFAPYYGNSGLQAEKSSGWDAGLEQKILSSYKLGVTYFQNDFENQVEPNSSYQYMNLEKTQTKGWEVFGAAEPLPDLVFRLGYTKLTANDLTHEDAGGPLPLLRRADYKCTFDAGYRWGGVRLQVSAQRVGARWDMDFFTGRRVVADPYTLVNANLGCTLTKALEISLRVHNLLDADYTDVYGYNTPRFSAFGGIQYRWK